MACYYSKNPINVQVTTAGAYNTTEIQIFAETQNGSATYNSLGTFRFISDGDSEVNQDISGVLDAFCLKLLKTSVPNADSVTEELPLHSTSWYISSRYYNAGTWSSFEDGETHYVLFGGVGYEEVTGAGLELVSQILQTNDNNFTTLVNDPAVYALIETPGTYDWEIEHEEYQEAFNGSASGTLTSTNLWSVVKLPVSIPADTYKTTAVIDPVGMNLVAHLITDNYPHDQKEEFIFLSMRNGWRSLTCTANLSSVIEVAQSTYETQQQLEYYDNNNIATTEVWRSLGNKKYKVATGFMPEAMIEQLLQDFLLSPKKFKWDGNLSKFLPVVVTTKSIEYFNSTRKGLKSFAFEYRMAFENNLPSKL